MSYRVEKLLENLRMSEKSSTFAADFVFHTNILNDEVIAVSSNLLREL